MLIVAVPAAVIPIPIVTAATNIMIIAFYKSASCFLGSIDSPSLLHMDWARKLVKKSKLKKLKFLSQIGLS